MLEQSQSLIFLLKAYPQFLQGNEPFFSKDSQFSQKTRIALARRIFINQL